MSRLNQWKVTCGGAVCGLLLAVCAVAAPLPTADARAGSDGAWLAAAPHVVETRNALGTPRRAGLSLPLGAALIGVLGLAVHGSPKLRA